MLQTISEAEKLYIQVGCDEGVRYDGRGMIYAIIYYVFIDNITKIDKHYIE